MKEVEMLAMESAKHESLQEKFRIIIDEHRGDI